MRSLLHTILLAMLVTQATFAQNSMAQDSSLNNLIHPG